MGRTEQPIPNPDRALGHLAQGLRTARGRAGLTYTQLARRAVGFSRPTLQRAASGKSLPTMEAVTAYAHACNAEPGPLLALWKAAVEERHPARKKAVGITTISDAAGLGAALCSLLPDAGSPSYREIDDRTRITPGINRVPCTTVHRILCQQQLPSSPAQLKALLTALRVPAAEQGDWLDAWSRASHRSQRDRQTSRTRKNKLQHRIPRPSMPPRSGSDPLQRGDLASRPPLWLHVHGNT
ncbi:helix-turn-helix domain-containing protein [Streptomyces sp. NPDC085665]|uniref:helix-turn-helix domain-containing protein n=1 Tax=Streptomyces sp. NPDC085665 TaxID=3365735 RepID=UPI0037D8475D